MVKVWLGTDSFDTNGWTDDIALQSWWKNMSSTNVPNRKALASLTILVSWTIWNERNARVFRNKSTPPLVLLNNIKTEVKLWMCAGAKCLSHVITGE
jgi:chemotaxis methyl-accepting protein methylase